MILAAVAALVGAAVQSATGFGFALVLSPALFAVLEPSEAVTTSLALGLVHNVLVVFERGRPGHVDWRRLAPVLGAAVPGLAIGVALLALLSKAALQVGVGVVVIAVAAWQLRRRSGGRAAWAAGRASSWAAGLLSGTSTTSISVSGPPIVLWLEAQGLRPVEFRATLAASFLAINLAGIVVLLAVEGGALDAGVVAPLLGMVLVGYALGALAFRRFPPERFSTVVLSLVVVTGVASVLAGVGVL